MHATLNGQTIPEGKRDYANGLWLVPITNTKPAQKPQTTISPTPANIATAVLEATNTKQELVRFHHSTCFYPVKSTWIK